MALHAMNTRLTAREYRILLIAILVAAASLAVCLKYFQRTFPEASLDLRVGRGESEQIALKFLAARGIHPDGYRHTVVFDYSDHDKLFLERSLGLERMNRLTAGPVHLWRWSHRWFRPQQKEEFRVEVTPQGQVVEFSHLRAENDPGANLEAAQARTLAESFVAETMHRDLADLEFVNSDTTKRPARTDYRFTWKVKSVDVGEGSLRVSTAVNGDAVSSFNEYVKVPEQWDRDYDKLRSRNDTAQIVDEVFFYLLTGALLVMLVLRLRARQVPVRTAGWFAGVAAALYFLSEANNFPLAESWYSTTDSYAGFVSSYFGARAAAALGVAVFIFILVAAAEPEYREGFPHLIPLSRYFSWKGLRSRSFFLANAVGLAMAFFFFGYQTLFYFCANKLGAWAPSDIPFTNQLNTRIPWVMVLFTGFFPAVTEEMQFRAFAIPFLRKWVRSLPLAIVLSAFNWGFLHSAYPNQPFFIRGLEVGVGGIIIGLVMTRFGILATLIWHYSVDALYSAFLLLRSPNHYLFFSGAFSAGIMLLPLAVALALYLKTGTFSDEAELLPAATAPEAAPQQAEAAPQTSTVSYQPLSAQRVRIAAALIVVCVAFLFVPVFRFGKGISLRMTANQAIAAGESYLRGRGMDPSRFRHAAGVMPNVDSSAVRYLTEQAGLRRADEVYRRATQFMAWEVRFFRPLEIPEQRVIFDAANGKFADYRPTQAEDAAGADLPPEQARALAEKALQERGFRLSDFELQNSDSEKRKARTDYTFTWQARPGDFRNVGEEKYRVMVDIDGDQVASVSDMFKLPEAWSRERARRTAVNVALSLVPALLGILILVRGVILFVGQLRAGTLAWRAAAPVALIVSGLSLVAVLNRLPNFEMGYSTSAPLATFWVQTVVGILIAALSAGLATWLLVALALGLYPESRALLDPARATPWRRDAALATLLLLALAAAQDHFNLLLTAQWPLYFPPQTFFAPDSPASILPALGGLASALTGAVMATASLGAAFAILKEGWSRKAWWLWAMLLLLAVSLGPANAHSLGEFFAPWLFRIFFLAAICAVFLTWFRGNLLAYVAALFATQVADVTSSLVYQSASFYRWNGILLAATGAAVLGWLLLPRAAVTKREKAASAT